MRSFIGKNDENQRLDRFLGKAIPLLPASLAQKYIRLKRIKVNGARAQRDQKLVAGDILQCYINDEFFESPSEENVYHHDHDAAAQDRPARTRTSCCSTSPARNACPRRRAREGQYARQSMLAYLYQKREWRPREENAFTPALCNRIDRNTGGIVVAAKNAEALRILNDKIRDREIAKYYLCIALGRVEPPKGRIECFLRKDERRALANPRLPPPRAGRPQRDHLIANAPDARRAVASGGRAAHGPYASDSREHGRPRPSPARRRQVRRRQREPQIWRNASGALLPIACPSTFSDAGILEYLHGREFQVDEVPFQRSTLDLNPTSGELQSALLCFLSKSSKY